MRRKFRLRLFSNLNLIKNEIVRMVFFSMVEGKVLPIFKGLYSYNSFGKVREYFSPFKPKLNPRLRKKRTTLISCFLFLHLLQFLNQEMSLKRKENHFFPRRTDEKDRWKSIIKALQVQIAGENWLSNLIQPGTSGMFLYAKEVKYWFESKNPNQRCLFNMFIPKWKHFLYFILIYFHLYHCHFQVVRFIWLH